MAETAAGAFRDIKGRPLPLLVQRPGEAEHGAGGLLAVMAEYWDRGVFPHEVHIHVSTASVHPFTGDLAGPAAYAPADINVNRHFIHSSIQWLIIYDPTL
jgi:hypothetical protein